MSTIFYNPSEGNVPPLRVPRRQSLTNAESEGGNVFNSSQLSQSSHHETNYARNDSDVSDDDLITAAQRGDHDAFVELCARYSSGVKRRILGIVRNQEDAEDALQDTLLRAYTHLTSFRRSCKFSTWLTTIGVNSALMTIRKRRVRRETNATRSSLETGTLELQEPIDRSLGPEGIYVKQEAFLLVRREVEKLRPSLRSVVNHYYRSECSLVETANSLGISLPAAKSRILRGRVRLRSALARYGMAKSRD
jgi:RNA polymerase sigma-70 factor, ECF subfamily